GEATRLLGRPVDARAALDNLLMGALYYRDALRRTGGDVEAAARLYHGGPNLALHGPRTVAYGRAVAWRYRLMTGSPAHPPAGAGAGVTRLGSYGCGRSPEPPGGRAP